LRWSYALAVHAVLGREGLLGADSFGYSVMASEFVGRAAQSLPSGFAWLGPDPGLMPVFFLSLAAAHAVAGNGGDLVFVLVQGVVDASACVIVASIARCIDDRIGFAAGMFAALCPTMIVMSGMVYTDSLFTLFVALSMYSSIRWLREPGWGAAAMTGAALGAAALCRVLVVPWTPILLVLLLASTFIAKRLRVAHFLQLALCGSIVLLAISPVVARNLIQHGSWTLTPQGGPHLALWVVPLVAEAATGTPYAVGVERMKNLHIARHGAPSGDRFEESRRLEALGREELARLGPVALAKAWSFGAAINLGAPAALVSPPVSTLPRTGFYDTPGDTRLGKAWNFLFRSGNPLHAWIVLLGAVGVVALRLLQLRGLIALLGSRAAWPALVLGAMWIGYIVVISGPVGSPKYRLPAEPVLAILSAAGWAAMRRRDGAAPA
jgi:4-amino-4-deoxy-L-arabinose transferase-like glycosyltransferase